MVFSRQKNLGKKIGIFFGTWCRCCSGFKNSRYRHQRAATRAAMDEHKTGTLKTYDDYDEMMKDIDREHNEQKGK
jgi:hypothetical protein